VDAEEIHRAELQNTSLDDVRRLVESIRTADLGSLRSLSKTLVHLDIPGMFSIMKPLVDDDNPDLSLAAYDWLARTSDDRATTILVGKLEGIGSNDNERGLAAEALSHRRDPAALESVRCVAERYLTVVREPRELRERLLRANLGDSVARLLVKLAVTEAELGGDELAGIPVVVARADFNSGRESIVRIEAVTALVSVAAPGMLAVLHDALLDQDAEVAERAIRPLQLIGAREAVDALIEGTEPGRLALAELALTAIVAVTGPGPGMGRSVFDLPQHELDLWWQTERPRFRSNVCYRLGQPLSISTLVELLRDPEQRSYAAEEIWIITGFDCDYDIELPPSQQESVFYAAQRWFASAGTRYKTGVLYKFGYERKLNEVLQSFSPD
jgi:hypothetical protein